MKIISTIAVMTALAMSAPSIAYAQVSLSGTVDTDTSGTIDGSSTSGNVSLGTGGSTTTVDINADGTTNPGQAASGSASVNILDQGSLVANFDVNGDGAISEDEVASANIILALAGSTATVDLNGDGNITQDELAAAQVEVGLAIDLLDTDGDGVISAEEQAAAPGGLMTGGVGGGFSSISCAETGLDDLISSLGAPDMGVVASASNVSVVAVSGCGADEVADELASEGAGNVRTVLAGNPAAVNALQGQGANLGDVLGATTSGNTLTVYVSSGTTAG